MTRDTFKAKGIPFDPPTGTVTHEYRVMVNAEGLLFQTSWYIESHARIVMMALRSIPGATVRLQRRRIVGNIETL